MASRPTTSTVRSAPPKPAPAPAPKPKNVDKVEFNKPKPKVDVGIYKPPTIKLIDPKQELRQNMQELNQRIKTFEPVTAKETKTKPKPSAAPKEMKPSREDFEKWKRETSAPKPKQEDYDPMPHCQEDLDKMFEEARKGP